MLLRVEDMREHCVVFPTPRGGGHTLWVLGHLAFIEAQVVRVFMLGVQHPLEHWRERFDGDDVSGNVSDYPPFDDVLAICRAMRTATVESIDTFTEADLDAPSAQPPTGFQGYFGTRRLCLQYVADHWYMHRGQLADARRAAGIDRIWL